MNWLIRKLVDNGWVRLGLFFRWILGTKRVLTALVHEAQVNVIKHRYGLLQGRGFFSEKEGGSHQQAFIQALFVYDKNSSAFSKILKPVPGKEEEHRFAPFKVFLDFIKLAFFNGPFADANKQAFTDAALAQRSNGQSALSDAAFIENNLNPLSIVLDALEKVDCFKGPFAASNKKAFIRAIAPCCKDDVSVLKKVMSNPALLERILALLTDARDVTNETSITGELISALATQNSLGSNALFDEINGTNLSSLRLIHKHLKQTGCCDSAENQRKLIDAIFAQNKLGRCALHGAYLNGAYLNGMESYSFILNMLIELGCLKGYSNQHAFMNAVLAISESEGSWLSSHLLDKRQILEQLKETDYFAGQEGSRNKQRFIDAVLTVPPNYNRSLLSEHCDSDTFPLLIEHLTAAGCFTSAENKQKFIDAAVTEDKAKQSLFSRIFKIDHIILLLNKLEKAGCFDDENHKRQFCEAVRAHEHEVLFRVIGDDHRGYCALRDSLVKAGFSKQDFKTLLNEPKKPQWNAASIMMGGKPITPLVVAVLRRLDGSLVDQLVADGAELTREQEEQINQIHTKQEEDAKSRAALANRSARGEELPQGSPSSLSNLALLAKKQSTPPNTIYSEKEGAIPKTF